MKVLDVDYADGYTSCSKDGEHAAVWISIIIDDDEEIEIDLCEEHATELRDALTKALEKLK